MADGKLFIVYPIPKLNKIVLGSLITNSLSDFDSNVQNGALVRGLDSFPCAPGCRWMNQGFSYVFSLVEWIATGYHCKKVVHFV